MVPKPVQLHGEAQRASGISLHQAGNLIHHLPFRGDPAHGSLRRAGPAIRRIDPEILNGEDRKIRRLRLAEDGLFLRDVVQYCWSRLADQWQQHQ